MPAGRAGLRRIGIGVVDQGLYSIANFALTVLVARASSVEGFGVFAVISSTYLIVTAIVRGLTCETFNVRYAKRAATGAERSRWDFAASAAAGTCLIAGVLCGAVLVVVGLLLPDGTAAATTIVFGLALPGLLIQDFFRFAALAKGRPQQALANDIVTIAVQFGLSAAFIVTGHDTVATLVAAWGIAAYVGLAVGAGLLRVVPRPDRVRWWFRNERSLALSLAADDAASQSSQATGYVVALMGGLADAGALRAAQTVYGPPSIANMSVMVAVTPELVRVLHRSPRRVVRAAAMVAVSQVLIAVAWTTAAILLPDSVGRAAFGETWDFAQPLLLLIGIGQIGVAVRVGAMAGLRATGNGRQVLRARGVVTAIMWISTLTAAAFGGAKGVAIALAIANPAQAAVWWWYFRQTMRAWPTGGGRSDDTAQPVIDPVADDPAAGVATAGIATAGIATAGEQSGTAALEADPRPSPPASG